ncbi:MAG: hypothetical protein FWE05_08820 [Defluviitaleaceae bacterium]|nr:hypothetical protein [Defluviitaleaceae bacterium]
MHEHDIIIEETSYETSPVESLSEALYAFVDAYDTLQDVIAMMEDTTDFAQFNNVLKLTMYSSVSVEGIDRPPLSLYEIGVVYFPTTGKYATHKEKFEQALHQREDDVRALFVQHDGILPRLCDILSTFVKDEPPPQVLFIPVMRFLNECRRLTAMWA